MSAICADVVMSDRSEEEHYEELLTMYTNTNEQPELFATVGAPADVKLEYEESENEVLRLVEPLTFVRASLAAPSDSSHINTGTTMLTSLLGRFSLSRFLRPGPTICPKDLSPIPESPLSPELEASPPRVIRGEATSKSTSIHVSRRPGSPPRSSSNIVDSSMRQKRRKHNDESDSDAESESGSGSDWEPVARHRNNSARFTSRRNRAPRASARRPPPRHTVRAGKPSIQRASRGDHAPIPESSRVLHPTQLEGGLPTSDFTFEKRLRPARLLDHQNKPSAAFAHAAPVSPWHSSMEVDDMALSLSRDSSCVALLTPPPTELQYPDTEVEEDDPTPPILPGVRPSKITAILRLKQSVSPHPGRPDTDMNPDVQMGEDDAEGTTDSDGDDGDNEGDPDFAPPPVQAQPPRFRRKAQATNVQRKRDPRGGKKATSRRRNYAKGPDGTLRTYVTRDGEERHYVHWNDLARKTLRAVHGPVWCLFCTETAPGPDDKGRFSRVKDSPKRHLLSCKRFSASQYYKQKAEAGMDHERIVKRAVREQKAAGSIIRCPNDPAQKARLTREGFTHAKVLDELERLSTVYGDCTCCDFPHFSEFRRER